MKSMTGFGRGEADSEGGAFRVEISSVNRKQSDIVVNMPRELSDLEADVRKLVGKAVARGRVTVKIHQEKTRSDALILEVDEALAKQYQEACMNMGGSKLDPTDLLRAPGVFSLVENPVEPDDALPVIEKALHEALAELVAMRNEEGAHLKQDIEQRLDALRGHVEEVKKLAPAVAEYYRKSLHQRLADSGLELPLDDDRVLREVGIFAERCDITEELTRLASHFNQMARYLESGEPVGRPIDFLIQEIGREFNTIGSKANDAAIAQHVVEGKTELEKIREQVQNIE